MDGRQCKLQLWTIWLSRPTPLLSVAPLFVNTPLQLQHALWPLCSYGPLQLTFRLRSGNQMQTSAVYLPYRICFLRLRQLAEGKFKTNLSRYLH